MGDLLCMGLFLKITAIPTPRLAGRRGDHAHHRLPARMDVDVFDRDLLLPLATMMVEGFEQDVMALGRDKAAGADDAQRLAGWPRWSPPGAASARLRLVTRSLTAPLLAPRP